MIEKNIHRSKSFKIVIISGGAVVVILAVFILGIDVGFHKAAFSYRVGEHYDALFGKNDRDEMPSSIDADTIPGGHEAAGKIIAVELPDFVVIGPDNIEKKVEIASGTVITEIRGATTSSAIKVGDSAVIIGAPSGNADMSAQFIRIFPADVSAGQ